MHKIDSKNEWLLRSASFTANFWKTKTFFKKLEYRFLVESTKIENISFPYKSFISQASVKYKMDLSQKQSFYQQLNYFLKILFQFKNLS